MADLVSIGILGTGRAVPERIVTNADFPESLGTSDAWIRPRTGILERRYVSARESTTTLALSAARSALEDAGVQANELELIICATVTPERMTPSTACLLQAELRARSVPCFDLTAACSGFIYALGTAVPMLQVRGGGKALIVGAETLSRTVDHADRSTCVLFGDGAGAVVLGPTDGNRGLFSVNLFSDGSRGALIEVPSLWTLDPTLTALRMHGREVYKFAVTKLTELIRTAQTECERVGRDLSLIVPHQVNVRILDAAREELNLPADHFFINLDRYGNTSAASVPMALDEARRGGRAHAGDTVLLAAFGGGLTWAWALVTL